MPASANRKTYTLHQFYSDAIKRTRDYPCHERYGQAMFNYLSLVRPDLAGKIRGTECDPFHIPDTNHPNWDRFVSFIEANWY